VNGERGFDALPRKDARSLENQGGRLMLVLSRKLGERIVMSDGVVLTVLAMHGSQIRLGVEAPPDVSVWREEIFGTDRRKREPSPHERSRA
jgi:carbon storage regulator